MSLRPWAPLIMPERITGAAIDRMLDLLVQLNVDYLREHPQTPPLYKSGVRYRREPIGEEKWLTIPWVLKFKHGDCEDLATWRAAELQVRVGENARPIWSGRVTPRGRVYHIQVMREDGSIEDPSAVLGMGVEFAGRWGETTRVVR